MDVYQTEEEQVEAIRKWWKENGRAVVAGVVIALVGVFGWRYWQGYRHAQAEAASLAYEQVMSEMAASPEKALELARQVVGKYPTSTYASLSSLAMAKISLGKGDDQAAAAQLRWVLDNAKVQGFKDIARLRLARVLLGEGKAKEALVLLQGVQPGSFAGQYDEVRGDIQLALGRPEQARKAYTAALAGYAKLPAKRQLVQLKLNDLAGAGEGKP